MTYLRPGGIAAPMTYSILPTSRLNVWVNTIPGLASTDVSAIVESTNAVPIIVERAMYSNAAGVAWAAGTNALASLLP